jgi:hypothetical protein
MALRRARARVVRGRFMAREPVLTAEMLIPAAISARAARGMAIIARMVSRRMGFMTEVVISGAQRIRRAARELCRCDGF